ncbi:hypothetical protein PHBOTO_002498 [Pseudozyma hubeiensis]|nr:hypothetical protein PHBOTO_002498 [Pseudozyma hubeiensis]
MLLKLFANALRGVDDGNVLGAQSRATELHLGLRGDFLDPGHLYRRNPLRLHLLSSYLTRGLRLAPLHSTTSEKVIGAATSAATQRCFPFLNMVVAFPRSSSIHTTTSLSPHSMTRLKER